MTCIHIKTLTRTHIESQPKKSKYARKLNTHTHTPCHISTLRWVYTFKNAFQCFATLVMGSLETHTITHTHTHTHAHSSGPLLAGVSLTQGPLAALVIHTSGNPTPFLPHTHTLSLIISFFSLFQHPSIFSPHPSPIVHRPVSR